MHLKYLRKKGYLFWDELGCLARAFGFPADVFYECIPDEYTSTEPGLTFETLVDMMETFRYFGAALDRTCNIHTDQWNLQAITKVLPLINSKIFSFEELRAIRVAYQMYESSDTKGLIIDETTLLRALKMCRRMISPMKLMHRIKHMRRHLEEADRIQLHEFFDLLLWADDYESGEVDEAEMDRTKNDRNLFQITDFNELVTHHDKKMEAELDAEYIKQERCFTRVQHSSAVMPKDVAPVNTEIRKQQVKLNNLQYRDLRDEVYKAQDRVYKAKAGYVRGRPISAPEVLQRHKTAPVVASRQSTSMSNRKQRPLTVMQIAGSLIRPKTPATPIQDVRKEVPRVPVQPYQRPGTPVAVTSQDLTDTHHTISALNFQQETIEMKYQQLLNEELEYHVPNYRERLINKPLSELVLFEAPPMVEKRTRKERRAPDYQRLHQMAYHKHSDASKYLTPSHAKSCDARLRGWGNVPTKRGGHHILTAPSFEQHPTRKLVQHIHQKTCEMSGRDGYTHRYTHPHQVTQSPQSPRIRKSKPKPKIDDQDSHDDEAYAIKHEHPTSMKSDDVINAQNPSENNLSYQKEPDYSTAGVRSGSQGGASLGNRDNGSTRSMATNKHWKTSSRKNNKYKTKQTAHPSDTVTENSENNLQGKIFSPGSETNVDEMDNFKSELKGETADIENYGVETRKRDERPAAQEKSAEDDILSQITAEIEKLAERAPDWLSEILMGNTSGREVTNRKPSYRRLAHRAGTAASANLKAQLSSVG